MIHKPLISATAAAVAALGAAAVVAPAATAKPQTMRFYQVGGPTKFFNAANKPIKLNPPQTLPKAGDWFVETDTDYAGTPSNHAKRWTATDRLACTFTNSNTGTCNTQVAIGGSMLLFDAFTLHFQDNAATVKLTGGTGTFSHASGSLTITDLPNGNAELTVKVS